MGKKVEGKGWERQEKAKLSFETKLLHPPGVGAAMSQAAPVGQKYSLRNEIQLHNHNVHYIHENVPNN